MTWFGSDQAHTRTQLLVLLPMLVQGKYQPLLHLPTVTQGKCSLPKFPAVKTPCLWTRSNGSISCRFPTPALMYYALITICLQYSLLVFYYSFVLFYCFLTISRNGIQYIGLELMSGTFFWIYFLSPEGQNCSVCVLTHVLLF